MVDAKPSVKTVALFSTVFFLISLTGIIHHEMWLDEMHHWLLAKESGNLMQMFSNMRYEGHPPAWNILLFVVTRFTSNPFYMQLLHIIIATAAITVFVYEAPFSLIFKAGILFSYFIFYEYAVISRNYALGILITWIICSLFSKKDKKYLTLSLLIGMLALIHLFFLFLSCIFYVIVLSGWLVGQRQKAFILSIIFFVCICVAVYFVIPPDNHFLHSYNLAPALGSERIEKSGSIFIKAFLHIPDFTIIHCWNSNFLLREFRFIFFVPAILYIFLPALLFYKNRVALLLFYLPSFAVSLFLYFAPVAAGIRYPGMVYIFFITALWIQKSGSTMVTINQTGTKHWFDQMVTPVSNLFMFLLFSSQIISSAIMYVEDFNRPFSNGKETAKFLENPDMSGKRVAVSDVSVVSSLGGFSPKELYSIEAGKYCSFSPWNVSPFQYTDEKIAASLKNLKHANPGEWVLVTNHVLLFNSGSTIPVFNYRDPEITVTLLKSFTGSMVSTGNYFVYIIN